MMEPLLTTRGLSAGYGRLDVIHSVDLDVLPGELVALIGANGAGKSTMLKAISGLIRPSRGEIRFGERRLNGLPASRIVGLGVCHVPERRQIFGELTVRDNLVLGAYSARRDLRGAEFDRRLNEIMAIFPPLADRLGEEASALSGGQQQMLAIGRAMMTRPRLLLLDEPSLGLAPVLVNQIFDLLVHLRETGTTILLVEQNARAALRIADRGYVMETGRVVLAGTGPELASNPEVAARYLGVPDPSQVRSEKSLNDLAAAVAALLA